MELARLLSVIVAAVIIHNSNDDSPDYNLGTSGGRKSKCKIGEDGVSRGIETHSPQRVPRESVAVGSIVCEPGRRGDQSPRKRLTNIICSYIQERNLRLEQPAEY